MIPPNRSFVSLIPMIVDADAEEEKEQQAALTEKFQPLLDWLKTQASGVVNKGEYLVQSELCKPEIDMITSSSRHL